MLLPAKVFRGRKSINWAKSVLPVFIGDSRKDPGSMLRLQIVDTGFYAEIRKIPGVQSGRPSVNWTAVISGAHYRRKRRLSDPTIAERQRKFGGTDAQYDQ
jgi:hypothetical protein